MSNTQYEPPKLDYRTLERLLVMFVATEVKRCSFERVLFGLSGGIDSAVVAAICVKALGTDRCLGVMMPYRSSSPASEGDARVVADSIGLKLEKVDISGMADGYPLKDISPFRRGNLLARLRMATLFDLAARDNALVIGTSNKTELLLGYSTWFGDGAWSLCPIGDMYKQQIVALAQSMALPPVVWEKPPSADLWDGQTDEGELGFSYDDADRYLWMRVDLRMKPESIIATGFNAETSKRIEKRIAISHYKRNQPPIAKLQVRSVGTDYLYARDTGT
jgi:NAD+ synthase